MINPRLRQVSFVIMVASVTGCGTTRSTDTARCATEMLLISNAVDQSVNQLDFGPLRNQDVFLDVQYLDNNVVDRGYLISSVRQHLVAHGAALREKREEADFVVELRSGGIGTDGHSLLIGVPQMNLPTVLPGQPSHIPEIPFLKKTDQLGVAKLGVFVYERESGRAVWQSGTKEGGSSAKDTWVLGAGPFRRGSVNAEGTALAGTGVASLNPFCATTNPEEEEQITVTTSTDWKMPKKQPPQTRIASDSRPSKIVSASASETTEKEEE